MAARRESARLPSGVGSTGCSSSAMRSRGSASRGRRPGAPATSWTLPACSMPTACCSTGSNPASGRQPRQDPSAAAGDRRGAVFPGLSRCRGGDRFGLRPDPRQCRRDHRQRWLLRARGRDSRQAGREGQGPRGHPAQRRRGHCPQPRGPARRRGVSDDARRRQRRSIPHSSPGPSRSSRSSPRWVYVSCWLRFSGPDGSPISAPASGYAPLGNWVLRDEDMNMDGDTFALLDRRLFVERGHRYETAGRPTPTGSSTGDCARTEYSEG